MARTRTPVVQDTRSWVVGTYGFTAELGNQSWSQAYVDPNYGRRHGRAYWRTPRASFWKGFAQFVAGAFASWSTARFVSQAGRVLAESQGIILGKSLAKLIDITVGSTIAAVAPGTEYGWGMRVGAVVSMIPALRNPPTPMGLLGDMYDAGVSAGKAAVSGYLSTAGDFYATEISSWGQYLGGGPYNRASILQTQPWGGSMGFF